MAKRQRTRKREKKYVPEGRAYINATFNNTIITFTNLNGDVVTQSSAGAMGFKGSHKSTSFAASRAADNAAKSAMDSGMRTVNVFVKGPGSGRDSAIRSIQSAGINVIRIKDITPLPHNGCRPPKRRRP